MKGNTELIHLICDMIEIRMKKSLAIKSQKYEEGAKLRDAEKSLIRKIGDVMVKCGITENLLGLNSNNIGDVIKLYLENTYGVSLLDENTPKVLKRHLKLEEIFKKD